VRSVSNLGRREGGRKEGVFGNLYNGRTARNPCKKGVCHVRCYLWGILFRNLKCEGHLVANKVQRKLLL